MRGRRPDYAWVDISRKARIARLMSRVKKRKDGCWEWTGKRFKNGYGQVGINETPRKTRYHLAHRLMWELYTGERLGRQHALHTCDRPWCVRPSHLYAGTPLDNAQDMIRRGRQRRSYGERSSKAKLTAKAVRTIRRMRAAGALQRDLARRFSVSPKQISVIVNKIQWKHLP